MFYSEFPGLGLPMPFTALKEGGGTDGKVLVKWDVTPDVLPDSCHRG